MAGKLTGSRDGPPGDVSAGLGHRRLQRVRREVLGEGQAAARNATTDLAADLKAGKITPQVAVERVIDRVVDKQLGANASASVREKVRAALESAVADDPFLADNIRGLA